MLTVVKSDGTIGGHAFREEWQEDTTSRSVLVEVAERRKGSEISIIV